MAQQDLHTLAHAVGQDWVAGKYYDDAERDMGPQWDHIVWPTIAGADFGVTLDLAAGHGRNTARLLQHAGRLIAVDINETNVDVLRERFAAARNVSVVKNNGVDLRDVAGASVTFLYSFDAMVHFDSDVVRTYIKEFRRVMKPGAKGFCHYSNNDRNPTGTYRDHPGWRNFMNRPLFEHWLAKEGFTILRSHYIKLGQGIVDADDGECDAVTLFELPADAAPGGEFLDLLAAAEDGPSTGAAAGIRNELSRLNGEVAALHSTVRELETKLDNVQAHADGLEKTREELETEKHGLQRYVEHLRTQLEHLQAHADGLEKIAQEWERGYHQSEAERARVAAELEELRKEAAHPRAGLATLAPG